MPANCTRGQSSLSCSHGHFKLLHPLPLHLLSLAEELEALFPLEVDQVEAIRPLQEEKRADLTAKHTTAPLTRLSHCSELLSLPLVLSHGQGTAGEEEGELPISLTHPS